MAAQPDMHRGSEEEGVGSGAAAVGPVRLTFKGPQGLVRSHAARETLTEFQLSPYARNAFVVMLVV